MSKMSTVSKTPRPVPVIQDELTFSRKRPRTLPFDNIPPKSPIKSVPPVSRIFRHRQLSSPGAHPVSFRQTDSLNSNSIQSPLYTNTNQLYFDQCFTVLCRLGAGSFGEVMKVQSKEDGKLYAIKKSRQQFRGDYDRRQQLEEVNKNELLQGHPNCVQFYKAWEERQYLYIQSELCEMSLKDYAENVQHIEEKVIWHMISDLSKGLKHIHDSQFVHMDVKPANLFLGRDGLYKIGDFGLVVELTRDPGDALEGDPKYMAPELMDGKFSQAADIFSFGITMLELACSLELPRGGLLWQQLRHGKLPMEFTEGLSDDLIVLIQRMMDPSSADRPSIDDILKSSSVLRYREMQSVVTWDSKFAHFGGLFWIYLVCFLCLLQGLLLFPKRFLEARFKARPLCSEIDGNSYSSTSKNNESSFCGHESILCSNPSEFNQTPPPVKTALFSNATQSTSHDHASARELRSPISRHSRSVNVSPCDFSVDSADAILLPPSVQALNFTPTRQVFCSSPSPKLGSSSPRIVPASDRILRSRVGRDSELPRLIAAPKNLLDSFEEAYE